MFSKKLSVCAFWAGLFREMVSWYKVCLDEQQMSQQGCRWFLVTPKRSWGSSCKVKVLGHNVLQGRLGPLIYFRESLNSLHYCILCRFMRWRWALQGLSAQTDGERMGFSSWLLLNFLSIISDPIVQLLAESVPQDTLCFSPWGMIREHA